jgi:mRNA interferase RelE/StbE
MSLEYHFNKTFLKELSKIPEKQRIKIESFVFSEVRKYKTPEEIPNLGKLKYSTLFQVPI